MTDQPSSSFPILYSFRRCPYAMRARLSLYKSGNTVELREIILRNKPEHMLEISPKGTVPVLLLKDGTILEESLDIMNWAFKNSVETWPRTQELAPLISENDTTFKRALDRYKYPTRYPNENISKDQQLEIACAFLEKLEQHLTQKPFLEGEKSGFTDYAIFPFIRQFANVDKDWFASLPYLNVQNWLHANLESDLFQNIMPKFTPWSPDDNPIFFTKTQIKA